jgi:ribosomal protein S18 acetylase RimI-like enzyme
MDIRDFQEHDLPALIDLTIEAFRPLFETHLPDALSPQVFAHDHGAWEADYRQEVPTFHDPGSDRFVTLAEEQGRLLGYVGWTITHGDSGRLEMVAVHPEAQRLGVGTALCREVLDRLHGRGVAVVHIGTGGDAFHAPARRLYESLGFTGWPVVDYTRAL